MSSPTVSSPVGLTPLERAEAVVPPRMRPGWQQWSNDHWRWNPGFDEAERPARVERLAAAISAYEASLAALARGDSRA